jgi:enamine deaminase RidA (YjgF/YER057c/UK114 family)
MTRELTDLTRSPWLRHSLCAVAAAALFGAASPVHAKPPQKQTYIAGVPWESLYGYVQAVRVGDWLYISGQLSHDTTGNQVAPAPVNKDGRVTDFSNMEAQMRQTYANAAAILKHFGVTPDHVVEEVLYVLDMDAAFAVAGTVRKHFYATERPRVSSTILVTPRLAFPTQLIEVKFVVKL